MTTITIDRAVAQQALEAMLNFPDDISDDMFESIVTLKAALAQQAEPVQDLIPPESLFVCDQMGAHVTRVRLAQQAEPQTIDEAMRLPRAMAQAYENGYKAGVAHEREACERACKHQPHWVACAAAIRARGVQS